MMKLQPVFSLILPRKPTDRGYSWTENNTGNMPLYRFMPWLFLSQKRSTWNGRIPNCSLILGVDAIVGTHLRLACRAVS